MYGTCTNILYEIKSVSISLSRRTVVKMVEAGATVVPVASVRVWVGGGLVGVASVQIVFSPLLRVTQYAKSFAHTCKHTRSINKAGITWCFLDLWSSKWTASYSWTPRWLRERGSCPDAVWARVYGKLSSIHLRCSLYSLPALCSSLCSAEFYKCHTHRKSILDEAYFTFTNKNTVICACIFIIHGYFLTSSSWSWEYECCGVGASWAVLSLAALRLVCDESRLLSWTFSELSEFNELIDSIKPEQNIQ